MYVTVAQFAASTDKEQNLSEAIALIETAAARATGLVVLPENAMFLDPDPKAEVGHAAEALDGPFASAMSAAAGGAGVMVVAGMTEAPEPAAAGETRATNAVVAWDEDGSRVGVYRKVHLYDAFGHRESDRIRPHPPRALLFEREGLTFGVMTCYDLRFPEMARFLVDAGADALVVPAAWVVGPAKEDHWMTLARSRAIENTVYVLACGQTGPTCTGHSAVIDPMGQLVASAGEMPGIATAWIDKDRVAQVRLKNPSLANRRFGVVPGGAAAG